MYVVTGGGSASGDSHSDRDTTKGVAAILPDHNVRFWLLADSLSGSKICPLLPRKRTFLDFLKITFLISAEMSAFGGKADLFHCLAKSPLIAEAVEELF